MSGVGSDCIKYQHDIGIGYQCACNKCDKVKTGRKERSDKGKRKIKNENTNPPLINAFE